MTASISAALSPLPAVVAPARASLPSDAARPMPGAGTDEPVTGAVARSGPANPALARVAALTIDLVRQLVPAPAAAAPPAAAAGASSASASVVPAPRLAAVVADAGQVRAAAAVGSEPVAGLVRQAAVPLDPVAPALSSTPGFGRALAARSGGGTAVAVELAPSPTVPVPGARPATTEGRAVANSPPRSEVIAALPPLARAQADRLLLAASQLARQLLTATDPELIARLRDFGASGESLARVALVLASRHAMLDGFDRPPTAGEARLRVLLARAPELRTLLGEYGRRLAGMVAEAARLVPRNPLAAALRQAFVATVDDLLREPAGRAAVAAELAAPRMAEAPLPRADGPSPTRMPEPWVAPHPGETPQARDARRKRQKKRRQRRRQPRER